METNNRTALFFTLIIISVAFGLIAEAYADPYLPKSVSNSKKGYESGFSAAKQLVQKSPLGGMYRTPDDVRALSGSITAVGTSEFTLHSPSNDPFADPALNDRTVRIDASTVVYKVEPRDGKTYQKEMEAYLAAVQHASSTPTTLTPPASFTKVQVAASALVTGALVNVMAKENVRDSKEFTATEIDIQQQAGAR